MFSVFVGPYPPKVLRCGTLIFCAISTIGSSEIHGNHLLSIYSDRGTFSVRACYIPSVCDSEEVGPLKYTEPTC